MQIETVEITSLQADEGNARRHDERNIAAIRASLEAFGQQKPIVVDGDGVVVAGNGTLDAASGLGWDTIDVVRTELTGAAAQAFAVADNRTAELACWDDERLGALLDELRGDESIDVTVTGFKPFEIDELLAANGNSADFDPVDESNQGRLDEKDPVRCPECGHEFTT